MRHAAARPTRLPTVPVRNLLPAALLATALLGPTAASAEGCPTEWREPVVCEVELSVAAAGDRRASVVRGHDLELPTRARLEIYADPYDQWERRFPLDRFELRIEPGRDCSGLVTIERQSDEGRFLLETGGRAGICHLLLWVPGNLNLDRELRIEVSRERAGGYTRREAELLARWLFQGILGRDGDDAGLRAAATEIQRGTIGPQVEAMVRSPEFRQRRAGLPAHELLEDLYRGLLGRDPDTAGVRTYLDAVQRGDLAGVAMRLLSSEELEERLAREIP